MNINIKLAQEYDQKFDLIVEYYYEKNGMRPSKAALFRKWVDEEIEKIAGEA